MSVGQMFMHFLYGLQHYPSTCTAYRLTGGVSGTGGGDYGHPSPQYVPVYMGSCLQSFWLVVQHYATYFSFGG